MSPPAQSRWLSGPWTDLLFGCGLIYAFAFAALTLDGEAVRHALPLSVIPFLILLTGVPHYGATLLRVYDRRADRQRYVVFALFATVALMFAFVVGLYEVTVGSWLLTIYLTWSPWHYSGQNYGISLMFLRRRGVEVTPIAKRLLHASFVLSFLLAVVMMHSVDPDVSYAPGQYEDTVFRLVALDLPGPVIDVLIPALVIIYVLSLLGAARSLLAQGSARDLIPTAALVLSQALWFVVPALARRFDLFGNVEPLGKTYSTYAFLWVAMTHAVQYLWITHYYARGNGESSSTRWAAKAILAGAAIWMVPAMLFAPGVLGLLIASVVNIHHFILDGVIWKLRDGPIARILLRGQLEANLTPPPTEQRWLRKCIWSAGLVSALLWIATTYEQAFGLELGLADGDIERVETAHQRLTWMGQESAKIQFALAMLYQGFGDHTRADTHAARALDLHPGADTLMDLSRFHHRARRGDDAIQAAERGLALRSDSRKHRNRLAFLLVTWRGDQPAVVARAKQIALELVRETAGSNAYYLHTCALTRAAGGEFAEAIETEKQALAVAEAEGQARLADTIRLHITDYTQKMRH